MTTSRTLSFTNLTFTIFPTTLEVMDRSNKSGGKKAAPAVDVTMAPYMSGLDPLFHTYVNVLVSTIHSLLPARGDDHESLPLRYFRFCENHLPRPVRLVMIGGIIVAAVTFDKVRYSL